jgi:hypothetical protein
MCSLQLVNNNTPRNPKQRQQIGFPVKARHLGQTYPVSSSGLATGEKCIPLELAHTQLGCNHISMYANAAWLLDAWTYSRACKSVWKQFSLAVVALRVPSFCLLAVYVRSCTIMQRNGNWEHTSLVRVYPQVIRTCPVRKAQKVW